ncbi:hypothetical protein LJ739_17440 [Aestuariibacter halophilus]|uniref:Uncharacterized protein n=1 Tax=Fluctibacter halophilus TaxID=226011 RepID=A0ABS8GBX7_9ALTE|nr:hypothetical protein [Aestuariibacter halophilus]MCC2618042.1 hypothetical protein [Aestuariibacter halophilus]
MKKALFLSGVMVMAGCLMSAHGASPGIPLETLPASFNTLDGKALDTLEDQLDSAIDASPINADAYYWRARVLSRKASQNWLKAPFLAPKAKQDFEQALALAPENPTFRLGLFMYLINAPAIAGGDESRARGLLTSWWLSQPMTAFRAQLAWLRQDNDDDAIQQLIRATFDAYPKACETNLELGFLQQRHENFVAAHQAFTDAKRYCNNSNQRFELWQATYQTGRNAVLGKQAVEEGASALRHYIVHAPQDSRLPSKAWAALRLAQLQLQLRHVRQAQQLLIEYQETRDEQWKAIHASVQQQVDSLVSNAQRVSEE